MNLEMLLRKRLVKKNCFVVAVGVIVVVVLF